VIRPRLSSSIKQLELPNALKFHGEGEVDLKVNLVEEDKNLSQSFTYEVAGYWELVLLKKTSRDF